MLAGLAVFEREIHWFTQDMEKLQQEYFPIEPEPVFFHVSQSLSIEHLKDKPVSVRHAAVRVSPVGMKIEKSKTISLKPA